jgi:hypothetical protein
MGWGARVLIGLVLLLAGAAAATWALAHYQPAAKLFGVSTSAPTTQQQPKLVLQVPPQPANPGTLNPAIAEQIGQLQARMQRIESENQEVQARPGARTPCSSPSPRAAQSSEESASAISSLCLSTDSEPITRRRWRPS